ncbi:tyrosine-protein phosphatase [Embleya sp. NPDC005575]|uniref:tyrosine-protein phosphatase n=1 Tax=Embleya sp. NPDC005575 TaxID=3156892 RepID=UPI00339E4B16
MLPSWAATQAGFLRLVPCRCQLTILTAGVDLRIRGIHIYVRNRIESVSSGDCSLDRSKNSRSGQDALDTGLIAALVLALLGVGDKDIVADFALTELATARLLADWRAEHAGALPRWPGFGRAPAQVMELFLADLATTYGTLRTYVTDHVGFTEAEIEALRETLLEPLPPVAPDTP